jgi:NDP-sugar pyrophosphorylase family protein
MKAVILAAGYGQRMGKLAEYLPKPLIPIVNKPILQFIIENLQKAGLNDIIIVVGHLRDQIISFLTPFQKKGIKLTIIEAENYKKGPIHSFSACLDEIKNEEFILLPADFLMEPAILSDLVQRSKDYQIALAFNDEKRDFLHTTAHVSTSKKDPHVLGITSNLGGGKSEIKSLLPLFVCRIPIQALIEKSIELNHSRVIEAIELYLRQNKIVNAIKVRKGYWLDLDTIQDVLSANKLLLKERNSKIESLNTSNHNSLQQFKITKPILIGKNCSFENNCSIGPYVSIGDNCTLGKYVKIQKSIIFHSSKIPSNVEIENAIFFKGSSYNR